VKISVCVGSVRPAPLETLIASVRRQTWRDWELVVVGQGSDPTLRAVGEAAMRQDQRVRYIHIEPRGVSLARNVAVRAAVGDIIAITDDDCEAREDWLATVAECFASEPEVDVVGGAMVAPTTNRGWLTNCPEVVPAEALYDPVASGHKAPAGFSWVTGNVAFRPSVLVRAGPFDESFGPGAYFRVATDTDYLARLDRAGVRMRSTPRSVVIHTYGCRRGFRQLLRRSIDYSWGHGALAAKWTLVGDVRGREWLDSKRRDCATGWLRPFRPHRLPLGVLQLWYFNRGYERCRRGFRVAPSGVLEPLRPS
jgi:glycosyltransferase involved in cell wall biosynthesis